MNTVCAPLGTLLRNTLPGNGGTLDVFDDLLARAFACSCCLSHLPLLSGYDEPTTLSYQIPLFGPISADVRQLGVSTSTVGSSYCNLRMAWTFLQLVTCLKP
jgi:hypothetical protein